MGRWFRHVAVSILLSSQLAVATHAQDSQASSLRSVAIIPPPLK